MLVDVFYTPLMRWVEQHDSSTEGPSFQVSRSDIETVFSSVQELIAFSRCAHISAILSCGGRCLFESLLNGLPPHPLESRHLGAQGTPL